MINSNDFEKHEFTGKRGLTLPYRLYKPVGVFDSPRPLLVFLHGAGERGTDNEKTLNGVSPFAPEYAIDFEKYGAYFLVPQCPVDMQWVNTPFDSGVYLQTDTPLSLPLETAQELIDFIADEYAIDTSRLYLMGASMGGYGTWDSVTRFPGKFRAAMPICGGADPSVSDRLKAAGTDIWTFHGDADNSVPPNGTRAMVAALEKLGANITYSEYPGVGHGVWIEVHKTKIVYDWLFSKR